MSLLLSEVGKLECHWQAYSKKNKDKKETKKKARRNKMSDI